LSDDTIRILSIWQPVPENTLGEQSERRLFAVQALRAKTG
jgi:hypothetical protein